MRGFAILVSLVAISLFTSGSAYGAEELVGKKIADFKLQDFRGEWHALKDIDQNHLVVVAFIGTECPLAKLYGPRLSEMAKQYEAKGVTFLAVDSNRQDAITEIAHYAREHEISFPVLKDVGNVVADAFGATRTPEIFLLDKDRVVRYHGRVDDQYGVGFIRPEATSKDLVKAIDELVEGKPVTTASTQLQGCLIGRIRTETSSTEVTYSNQIARIFQKRCQECHREGEVAPFALNGYEDAAGWADMIAEVVREQRMPPWHASPEHGDFVNDARMTDEEKELVFKWVKAGAPEGDPKDLPKPVEYAKGWRIPKPDLILEMAEEYKVPAEGEVPYQYFVMDPKLTEDKWVVAAQCVAGNAEVVHHIIAFVVPSESAKDLDVGHFSAGGRPPGARFGGSEDSGRRRPARNRDQAENGSDRPRYQGGSRGGDGFRRPGLPGDMNKRIAIMRSWFTNYLVAMAPGTPPMILNDGMAKRLPAGCKIVFQSHYTPSGKARADKSKIGLVFTDPKNVKREVVTRNVLEQQFEIPPYDGNYEVKGSLRFREDTLLLEMFPHMHLRGKSFSYTAVYPDGRREVLLDVPRYDFGWQNIYTFREPKLMPRGTTLECVAHFNNSADNLSNPDPGASVRFGDQTWEEMMIGFFNMARAKEGPYRNNEVTRRDQFVKLVKDGAVPVSSELKRRAEKALESEEDFNRFWDEIANVMPQLDRVDVSVADGLAFRFGCIAQAEELPSTFKMKELPPQVSAMGPALGLYQMAIKRKMVVNDDPSQVKGIEMQIFTRIMPSSVHIPVRYQGKPAMLNFWSMDSKAFSPEAVSFLEQVGEIVYPSKATAQANTP